MSDLAKRLRIKAGMIEMGERIAWGSDSALMREAADALDAMGTTGLMGNYKLVPVEPTQEMVEAARQHHEGEAYLPVSLYKAMLAAAPAVQGWPVAVMYEDGSLLSKADCGDNFEICCKVQTPLYAAPQPAEQQPDVAQLVEALEALLEVRVVEADASYGLACAKAEHALAAYRKGGDHDSQ